MPSAFFMHLHQLPRHTSPTDKRLTTQPPGDNHGFWPEPFPRRPKPNLHSRSLGHSSMNATNLAFVRNRVCRKSGEKASRKGAKARRRKVNELIIFAPLREKFHTAIFLPLSFLKPCCSGVHREISSLTSIGGYKPYLPFSDVRSSCRATLSSVSADCCEAKTGFACTELVSPI